MIAVVSYVRMGIVEKILTEIDRKGTNQSRVARKAGLGVTMVSNVLSGRQRLYVDQALKLARALGVSLDYLADDEIAEPGEEVTPDELAVLGLYRTLKRNRGMDMQEAMDRLEGGGGGKPGFAGAEPG